MNELTQAEIKAKIEQLRANYSRLKSICGLQRISRETLEEYANALRQLQTQLAAN